MKPMRKVRSSILAIASACAFIILVPLLVARIITKQPGSATGDAYPIRLAGVWCGDTPELRNAEGAVVGETLGWSMRSFRDNPDHMWRVFIFDLPGDGDDLLVSSSLFATRPIGTVPVATQHFEHAVLGGPRGRRLYVSAQIQKTARVWWPVDFPFLRFSSRDKPVSTVSVTLRYWHGPRRKAVYTFVGPFGRSGTVAAEGIPAATLKAAAYYSTENKRGTWLELSAPPPPTSVALAYDSSGRRHETRSAGNRPGAPVTALSYIAEGLSPEQISAVTIGEEPCTRTFHNVLVKYDDAPEEAPPAYFEGERFRRQELSAVEILDDLEGLFGFDLTAAFGRIETSLNPDFFSSLPREKQESVRQLARKWSDADDPAFRYMALKLRLLTEPWESLAEVYSLEGKGWGGEAWRDTFVMSIMEQDEPLTADQVRLIKEICLAPGGLGSNKALLMATLSDSTLPEATEALLQMARDDRPWLWSRALHFKQVSEALGPRESWPLELAARHFISHDGDPARTFSDSAVEAEALKLLPSLITQDFETADSIMFIDALKLLAQRRPREKARATMVDYLRNMKDHRGSWEAVATIVRYINIWDGVDIGRLGTDVDAECPRNVWALNWKQIADEALQWCDRKTLAPDLPEGYKAGPGDLRFVCTGESDRERSLIALWHPSDSGEMAGGVRSVEAPGLYFTYALIPTSSVGKDYRLEFQFVVTGESSLSGTLEFPESELPLSTNLFGDWLISVEQADSPESVLSGSPAFSEWWARYGPTDGTAAGTRTDSRTGTETPREEAGQKD